MYQTIVKQNKGSPNYRTRAEFLGAVCALFYLLATPGCGTAAQPSGAGVSASGEVPQPLTGAAYYDTLLFQALGDCSKPSTVMFRSLSSFRFMLGMGENGYPLLANIELQLFQDHTYWFQYTEFAVSQELDNGGFLGRIVLEAVDHASWSVAGDQIVLPGIGTGIPWRKTENGITHEGIGFSFSQAIHDPRLLDKSVPLKRSVENLGPLGVSKNHYCGRADALADH